MSSAESPVLRLERTFAASPEELFDAWTNPEVLRRWWASNPAWSTPVAEVDLRVGGSYRLSMQDPESGALHTVRGEYHEVRRPERLVYSWSWEAGGDGAPQVSVVAVEFRGDADHTTVVIEHSGLPSEESRIRHRAGWRGCLGNLEGKLPSRSPRCS